MTAPGEQAEAPQGKSSHPHAPAAPLVRRRRPLALRWLLRYVLCHGHAAVGRQYLVAAGLFLVLGGTLAMLVRLKLAYGERSIPFVGALMGWPDGVMPAEFYVQSFTLHATVMIWLVVVPALALGLGIYLLPRLVGRRELVGGGMAGWSFWLLVAGASVLLVGWSGAGWTAYAPLGTETDARWVPHAPDWASWLRIDADREGFAMQSPWPATALIANAMAWMLLVAHPLSRRLRGGLEVATALSVTLLAAVGLTRATQVIVFDGQTAWFFAVGLWAVGGTVASASMLATAAMRRRRVLDVPAWGWIATAGMALLAGPVLVVAMTANLMDAHGVSDFFGPTGQPLLHQHLFWFYGHPLVYIMILPAFGFAGWALAGIRPGKGDDQAAVVGRRVQIVAIVSIGLLGFLVWAHHMYQSGLNPAASTVFSASSLAVALPSGLLVICWIATVARRRAPLDSAAWAAVAFVSLFVLGGLSGVILAAPAINVQLHDTYFVVAHLHYTLFGGSIFGLFVACYHFWPALTGRRLSERLGLWHVGLSYVAFNATFGLMHLLGMAGMPRRYADPSSIPMFERFAGLQAWITAWAFLLAAVQLLLVANMLWSVAGRDVDSGHDRR